MKKLNLIRDMTDAEQNFLHRCIDLDDLYRQPLPFGKIWVSPGREVPPTKFYKI